MDRKRCLNCGLELTRVNGKWLCDQGMAFVDTWCKGSSYGIHEVKDEAAAEGGK